MGQCPNAGLAGGSSCVILSYGLRLRLRSLSKGQAELAQGPFPSPFFCFDLRQVECDDAISQLWDDL